MNLEMHKLLKIRSGILRFMGRFPRTNTRIAPVNLRMRKSLEIREGILRFLGRLNGSETARWDHEPSAGRGWFMERLAALSQP
jgi:hypothetical protein